MKPLTDNERKILEAIKKHIEDEQYPPSIRELCKYTETSSTSVVDYCLDRLCAKNYIRRKPSITRSIVLLPKAFEDEPHTSLS